jgi:DNA-binding PucR family transcriptional regulator
LTATIGVDDADALHAFEAALTKAFEPGVVFAVVRHNGVTVLLRGPIARAAERAEDAIRMSSGQRASTAAVGIGLPVHGVQQLGRAHEQAMTALGLATPERPVVALADMPVTDYLIASADRVAHSMVPDSVRALAQSGRTSDVALVQTLRAYISSGLNVQQTAASLPAHPNTVHDRLRRLAAKTGYSLHDAEQLLRLSVELRLAQRR